MRGVYLNDNQLGDEKLKVLLDGLKNVHSIRELHLSDNRISDKGFSSLESYLSSNPKLTTLDVSSNSIGTERAQAFAQSSGEQLVLKLD